MKSKTLLLGLAAALTASAVLLSGCEPTKSTGAQRETAATNQLLDRASTVVGIPGITNFTEKKQLKMLYELRDDADLVTYSYYLDLNGNKHKVCPTTSVGYGMPFSAQFTAPSIDDRTSYGTKTIMQPEPNGLYMPDSTSATWVICLGGDGNLKPVYVEPQIIVSLEPMETVD